MSATQLRTQKAPHRAAVHGVHSLDSFVFTVPDMDEAERFYAAFGLEPQRTGKRLDLFTTGHPHAWGSLYQAPGSKKLQYLRFACFAEDLKPIAERLDQLGIAACEPASH